MDRPVPVAIRLVLMQFLRTNLGGLFTLAVYLVALSGAATIEFPAPPKPDSSTVKDVIEDDFNDCWLWQWCVDSLM